MSLNWLRQVGNASKKFRSNYIVRHSHGDIEAGDRLWTKLTIYVMTPIFIATNVYVFMNHKHEERPEFVPYDHLRIRTKRWPWGDGNHSFFHNPYYNALPNGYETDEEGNMLPK